MVDQFKASKASKTTTVISNFLEDFSFLENIKKFSNLINNKEKDFSLSNGLYMLGDIDISSNQNIAHSLKLKKELTPIKKAILAQKLSEKEEENSLINKTESIEKAKLKSDLFGLEMEEKDKELEDIKLEQGKVRELEIIRELEEEKKENLEKEKSPLGRVVEDTLLRSLMTLNKDENANYKEKEGSQSKDKGIDSSKFADLPDISFIKESLKDFDHYNIHVSSESNSSLGNLSPSSGMAAGRQNDISQGI